MTQPRILRVAQAKLLLGAMGADALPAVALSALEEGWHSAHLRKLAELSSPNSKDAQSIFADALREFDMREMSIQEAVLLLAQEEARELLSGRTAPISAARRIWDLALKLSDGDIIPQLDPFIYAASEWDDRPEDHSDFEMGIVESARDLLDS